MKRAPRQTGMTMIETMVAMAISAVLVLGSINMYTNARANYRTAENIARLQENLRFAAATLDQDIRLAGYWGMNSEDAVIVRDPAVAVTCAGNDVTDWALPDPPPGIDASEDAGDMACPGTAARADSDVLIVRHVDSGPDRLADAGRVQLFATVASGQIFSNGILPAALVANHNALYDVVINAYYVSNESKYDSNMPSLRRRSLQGTKMIDEEIIAGVENLQVQFGIDRDEDGQADGYVDADRPERFAQGVDLVSVRLWLLVRGDTDETGQGFQDDRVYPTRDADGLVIDPDAGPEYPHNYRRYAFTKTVKLKN